MTEPQIQQVAWAIDFLNEYAAHCRTVYGREDFLLDTELGPIYYSAETRDVTFDGRPQEQLPAYQRVLMAMAIEKNGGFSI